MASQAWADKRRLSHAYILSASGPEECLKMARSLSMAVLCSAGGSKACGCCRDCRKVEQGIHPDVVFFRAEKDKKEISVETVRQMVREAPVMPNEAERKVFVVEEAERMGPAGQNAALKLLEEPPDRLVLILCTTNPRALLPTVRSRCVEVADHPGDGDESRESVKLAMKYLKALSTGDEWELCSFCLANEGLDAAAARGFLQALESCSADMLCCRRDSMGLDRARLTALSALSGRCRAYLKGNTGVKHIFGLLAAFRGGAE